MLMSTATFSTFLVVPSILCVKIPDHLTFVDAASLPVAYATAIHALRDVGHVDKGQSVLIHSGSGGIGMAAIQVARLLGAEIFVTVGSMEKVQYLTEQLAVPRHRIFSSRDGSFVDGIMIETQGRGVDVALNSLSGKLLHDTWRCVAEFGTMVEIGKRDLLEAGKLDMGIFLPNRGYCAVDMDHIREKRPLVINRLLNSIQQFTSHGHIKPATPLHVFEANRTEEAFRFMQPGHHIGKIVVAMHSASGYSPPDITKGQREVEFDEDASYLLVGGLGGLGRMIAIWMVERGARHLLFLSPSATLNNHAGFVRELVSMGCQVHMCQGNVAEPTDVKCAIMSTPKPLKGVVQMAMVLCDRAFPQMTLNEWIAVTEPKVQGTWNLHRQLLSAGADLDFFVLFSSLSGIVGQPGQANYAAANAFLDAFVSYRRSIGLPASALDIGAVTDAGYLSENYAAMQKVKATGMFGLCEQSVLDAFALAVTSTSDEEQKPAGGGGIRGDKIMIGLRSIMPLSNPGNRCPWKKDRRMAVYHNTAGSKSEQPGTNNTLGIFLASAKSDPSSLSGAEASKTLATEIGRKLFTLLLKPLDRLDLQLPLSELGMDSLVAVEMRIWWRQSFRFDISVLEMLSMGSLEVLGRHAANKVAQSLRGGSE
ncbi:hypothetical protein EYZ11_012672 [Aspergillus tanneri]|nr:hypothetical protein EYZ11_012672 [Aspergillus tanneri]